MSQVVSRAATAGLENGGRQGNKRTARERGSRAGSCGDDDSRQSNPMKGLNRERGPRRSSGRQSALKHQAWRCVNCCKCDTDELA